MTYVKVNDYTCELMLYERKDISPGRRKFPPLLTWENNNNCWLHSSLELLFLGRSSLNLDGEHVLRKKYKELFARMENKSSDNFSDIWKVGEGDIDTKTIFDLLGFGCAGATVNKLFGILKDHYSIIENKIGGDYLILPPGQDSYYDHNLNDYNMIGLVGGKNHPSHNVAFLKINGDWYEYDNMKDEVSEIKNKNDIDSLNKTPFRCLKYSFAKIINSLEKEHKTFKEKVDKVVKVFSEVNDIFRNVETDFFEGEKLFETNPINQNDYFSSVLKNYENINKKLETISENKNEIRRMFFTFFNILNSKLNTIINTGVRINDGDQDLKKISELYNFIEDEESKRSCDSKHYKEIKNTIDFIIEKNNEYVKYNNSWENTNKELSEIIIKTNKYIAEIKRIEDGDSISSDSVKGQDDYPAPAPAPVKDQEWIYFEATEKSCEIIKNEYDKAKKIVEDMKGILNELERKNKNAGNIINGVINNPHSVSDLRKVLSEAIKDATESIILAKKALIFYNSRNNLVSSLYITLHDECKKIPSAKYDKYYSAIKIIENSVNEMKNDYINIKLSSENYIKEANKMLGNNTTSLHRSNTRSNDRYGGRGRGPTGSNDRYGGRGWGRGRGQVPPQATALTQTRPPPQANTRSNDQNGRQPLNQGQQASFSPAVGSNRTTSLFQDSDSEDSVKVQSSSANQGSTWEDNSNPWTCPPQAPPQAPPQSNDRNGGRGQSQTPASPQSPSQDRRRSNNNRQTRFQTPDSAQLPTNQTQNPSKIRAPMQLPTGSTLDNRTPSGSWGHPPDFFQTMSPVVDSAGSRSRNRNQCQSPNSSQNQQQSQTKTESKDSILEKCNQYTSEPQSSGSDTITPSNPCELNVSTKYKSIGEYYEKLSEITKTCNLYDEDIKIITYKLGEANAETFIYPEFRNYVRVRIIDCNSMISHVGDWPNRDLFIDILKAITPDEINIHTINLEERETLNRSVNEITNCITSNRYDDSNIPSFYTIIYFYFKYIVPKREALEYLFIDYRAKFSKKEGVGLRRQDAVVYNMGRYGDIRIFMGGFLDKLNFLLPDTMIDLVKYETTENSINQMIYPISK